MGDAYTGSGMMESDRRDRNEAMSKIEEQEAKLKKTKLYGAYQAIGKLIKEIRIIADREEKRHKEFVSLLWSKSHVLDDIREKLRESVSKK